MQEKDSLTALAPGVQLWMIPPLAHSEWSKRIDWYLGFQIRRSEPHQAVVFSPEMKALVDELEVEVPPLNLSPQTPLMIASETLLPNHQTVVVPMIGGEESAVSQWVVSCHRVWSGLGKPGARVFLPNKMTKAQFLAKWPQKDSGSEIEIVVNTQV